MLAIAPLAALTGPGQSKGVTTGPEFMLTPTEPVSAETVLTAVASDGTDFAVAWDAPYRSESSDVLVTRVSSSGEVLDPFGIPLSSLNGEDWERRPAIAFGGGTYLVVWQTERTVSNCTYQAKRVSPTGDVLDQAAIILGEGACDPPAVAFNGTDFVVLWTADDNYVLASRVSVDGTLLDPAGAPVGVASTHRIYPAIACRSGECLVAYYSAGGLYGGRLDDQLLPLDPDGIAISLNSDFSGNPAVSYDGTRFFVAWVGGPAAAPLQVHGTYIEADGLVIVPGGNQLTNSILGVAAQALMAIDSTTHFFWVETDASNYSSWVFAGQLDPLGSVVSTREVFSTGGVHRRHILAVSAAAGADNGLIAWSPDGVALGYSSSGEPDPQGPLRISARSPQQTVPDVVASLGEYFAVWIEDRYDESILGWNVVPSNEVYGARFDPGGLPLDGPGKALRSGNDASIWLTRVAAGAGAFLVTWEIVPTLQGRRFDSLAQPIDAVDIPLADWAATHIIAGNGRMTMIAPDRYNSRLLFLNELLELVLDVVVQNESPCMACSERYCLTVSYGPLVTATLYDTDGSLIGSSSHDFGVSFNECTAAFDGQQYLVVLNNTSAGCFGIRVASDGQLLEVPAIPLLGVQACRRPEIVFDGVGFNLTWITNALDGGKNLFLAQVSKELEVSAPVQVVFGTNETTPSGVASAMASLGGGTTLLTYSRRYLEVPYRTDRVVGRMIQRATDGSACQRYDECRSGSCVDGFCCDTPCGDGALDDCVVCSSILGADADGTCTSLPLGTSCGDQTSSVCTAPDTCDAQGQCLPNHASPSTECRPAADPCDALERCDGQGLCPEDGRLSEGAACEDGEPCTSGDLCLADDCIPGGPLDCDDANACTEEHCAPGIGCVFQNLTGPCDDDDACSLGDTCVDGTCRGGPMDRDGDGFVDVACGGTDCQDLDPAIHPATFEGPHGSPACADGLDNDCDGATDRTDEGCHECEVDSGCSDANLCNGIETCLDSSCQPGTPLLCDDQEPCTLDSCEPTLGCVSTPVEGPCDDGDACTQADRCVSGGCVGEPLECLALDSCHLPGVCEPASGTCTNPPAADGEPCETGTCQAGVCVASQDGGVEEEDAGEDGADGLDQDAADGEDGAQADDDGEALDAEEDGSQAEDDGQQTEDDGAQTEDDGTASPEEDAGLPDGAQDGESDQDAQTNPDDGSTAVGPGCGCGTTAPEGLVTLSLLLLGLAVFRSRTRWASP